MRWMTLSVALACATSCAAPAVKSDSDDEYRVVTTSDRANPQHVRIWSRDQRDYGEVKAQAPSAGEWWYLAEFPPAPSGALANVSLYLHYPSSRRRLTITWFDEKGEAHPPTDGPEGGTEINLPETRDAPTTYLIRVTTTRRQRFSLYARREWWQKPPPEPPPCDRDHIDPSNPNCEDVYPRCNLNDPDYKNPNCCYAACLFGKLSCRSKILRGDTHWAYIGIGADQEIMRGATGKVVVKNLNVADVIVWHVDEHESFLQIIPFKKLDNDMLKDALVILAQPTECVQRPGFVLPAHE